MTAPVKVNKQSVASVLRQVGGFVAIVLSLIPQVPMPDKWSRGILIAGGLVLFCIEHYVGDPSTGSTPVTPPASAPVTADMVQKALDIAHQAVSNAPHSVG